MRRRTLGLAAVLLLGTGCSRKPPLRFGFLGGLSGRMSDLGLGGRNGVQLAIEDLNATGGVLDRMLELVVRDDEQNIDTAAQRLGELYDSGVVLVIGPMTSTVAAAVIPLANQRRIPLISPLAGASSLAGQADAFFRIVSDSGRSAQQQAAALLGRGVRRLVTVADLKNVVFTKNWTGAAAERFAAGGGALAQALEVEVAPGLSFVGLAQRIVDAKPDAVIIAFSATDSVVLVQQLRRLAPTMLIALSVWAGTEELPQLGGRSLDGVVVTQFFDRFNATPRYLDFVERFQKRFGAAPGYQAMNAYDATQFGVSALRAAGTDAAGPLMTALGAIRELDGLQRKLTFDAFGDCLASTYLTEIREGRYVALGG